MGVPIPFTIPLDSRPLSLGHILIVSQIVELNSQSFPFISILSSEGQASQLFQFEFNIGNQESTFLWSYFDRCLSFEAQDWRFAATGECIGQLS